MVLDDISILTSNCFVLKNLRNLDYRTGVEEASGQTPYKRKNSLAETISCDGPPYRNEVTLTVALCFCAAKWVQIMIKEN